MAKARAKETSAKLVYLVGTKKFENEAAAFTGLVEETEKFVEQYAKPQVCSVSGAISIGGEECSCSELARSFFEEIEIHEAGARNAPAFIFGSPGKAKIFSDWMLQDESLLLSAGTQSQSLKKHSKSLASTR
jgi:hypothetical protein